jgi:hypothetical protein
MLTYDTPALRQTGSRNLTGQKMLPTHKLHIDTPYRGKRFWTHRIPTSCLPTLLIFMHIEHICSFFVAFFSAIIDGRNLMFGHKLQKRYPQYGIPIWCLWPNTRFLPSTVTEKNATKNILDGWKDGRTDGRTDAQR